MFDGRTCLDKNTYEASRKSVINMYTIESWLAADDEYLSSESIEKRKKSFLIYLCEKFNDELKRMPGNVEFEAFVTNKEKSTLEKLPVFIIWNVSELEWEQGERLLKLTYIKGV